MIIVLMILVILILLLILPVGIDAAYVKDIFFLKVKLGPVPISILPEDVETKPAKPKKPKKPGKSAKEQQGDDELEETIQDIIDLIRYFVDAPKWLRYGKRQLVRLFHRLSIDYFRLYLVAASDDPYEAVQLYGVFNAVYSAITPLLHAAFKVRDENVILDLDVMDTEMKLEAQLIATLQVWEVLYFLITTGLVYLRWKHAHPDPPNHSEKKTETKGVPVEQKG